jgi:hypothetical protein
MSLARAFAVRQARQLLPRRFNLPSVASALPIDVDLRSVLAANRPYSSQPTLNGVTKATP